MFQFITICGCCVMYYKYATMRNSFLDNLSHQIARQNHGRSTPTSFTGRHTTVEMVDLAKLSTKPVRPLLPSNKVELYEQQMDENRRSNEQGRCSINPADQQGSWSK